MTRAITLCQNEGIVTSSFSELAGIPFKAIAVQFGFTYAFLASFGGYFILARIYAWFFRKKEGAADDHAASVSLEHNRQTYADTLIILHKENLLPATFPKSAYLTHPSLYDRLEAMGVTPVLPHPAG